LERLRERLKVSFINLLNFGALTIYAGVTISGDGTSHKNEQYESKFATVIDENNQKIQFFLGIKMAANHTSETQLDGWIELIEEIYQLLFESGMCSEADARQFWNIVTGMHSDHAEDQKKLFRLLKEWKERCEREVRGENAVQALTKLELVGFLFKCSQEAIRKAGGVSAWEALPQEERLARYNTMRSQVIRDIGQKEFEKLSKEEQEDVDFFLWAGCCMHKDMNAFKGACVAMESWWGKKGLPGPVKMYNRDNAAAASMAPETAAGRRAEERTKGGAIKLASLCGAVFRHKDRKRGQQDTLRFFFDHELGFIISFPDTSNTRFQSHMEACSVLITYHDLFIRFLTYVKENKASRSLNHMEQNILDGLNCPSTRHELCIATMYYQAVSAPYMRQIRGPCRSETNLLRLGPLHKRVVAHIDKLIADPKLLVGNAVSFETGSLDGKPWLNPEAVYAVQRYAPDLPHLEELAVAFLEGARETWSRFIEEFAENGAIWNASDNNIERAWMEVTNDLNESSFGIFRQVAKTNPNIALDTHNSRQMFKFNATGAYIRSLSPALRKFLRKITRRQDASGDNRRTKLALARYRQNVAEKKQADATAKAQKKKAAEDAIDAVIPLLTLTEVEHACALPARSSGYMTIPLIDLQLDWHRKYGTDDAKEFIPKAHTNEKRGKRDGRCVLWQRAVDSYIAKECPRELIPSSDGPEATSEGDEMDEEEVTVGDLGSDTDSADLYSEEEYYQ
jgi:hypothetical protein